MQPVIDHVYITVQNIQRAEQFYDKFLPVVGFDIGLKGRYSVPEHEYEAIEYRHRNFTLAIVNQRNEYAEEKVSKRKAGAVNHLAFRTPARKDVDTAYDAIRQLPCKITHEPQYYPEYCKDYYAFFFKDSEGIEYEIVNYDRASCY